MWQLSVADMWGKFQFGILDGNSISFGDYDGCIEFLHSTNLATVEDIYGKYFIISYISGNSSDQSFGFDFSWKELWVIIPKIKTKLEIKKKNLVE